MGTILIDIQVLAICNGFTKEHSGDIHHLRASNYRTTATTIWCSGGNPVPSDTPRSAHGYFEFLSIRMQPGGPRSSSNAPKATILPSASNHAKTLSGSSPPSRLAFENRFFDFDLRDVLSDTSVFRILSHALYGTSTVSTISMYIWSLDADLRANLDTITLATITLVELYKCNGS